MDLNETAVFVKVVQAGSFSGAARQLQLPTSTISTRISRLEKRLGVTLLQRTTRRLSLTEAGSLYFQHAATGLGYMLEAEAAISTTIHEPQGRLKITAPADLGDFLLSSLVNRVQDAYPKIEMELLLTDRYVDLVAESVDAAIRTGALRDSSLIAKQVGNVRWAAFASREYLSSAPTLNMPQDLRHHPCVQFTPLGRDEWTLTNNSSSITTPMPGNRMVNSIGVVRAMVMANRGVGLLPSYVCRPEMVEDKLLRVLPDWHAKADPVHLVYPRQRFVPVKLRAFLDVSTVVLKDWFN
ncbi:LysR family transcriptional regulator [Methylobacillus gramineus]|uniref:LysR family transcriptional regulator n=1 Tax=Methylobacillus gramineus TaxID=755169 RepID=UPI001CFF59B1|nr:LysR family transcriptional regulator [Methylobacillus gramineus]MCB5185881.1 LysR family transcriptional regulator [Methylobacillus gramineus]